MIRLKPLREKLTVRNEHSVEDAEGLLNMVLLLDALVLSIVVPYLSIVDVDGWREIDRLRCVDLPETCRAVDTFAWGNRLAHFDGPVSYAFFSVAYMSIIMLFLSLATGLGIYMAMCWSRCREDAKYFDWWFSYARWFILLAYGLLAVALIYFFFTIGGASRFFFPY